MPTEMSAYKFQLLRYAPNRLSEEFYNIALFLYGTEGGLVDARFAPDFLRLRCNPLADLRFLQMLKEDFEDRRLTGEHFSQFVEDLKLNLSQGLQVTEEKFFLGGEVAAEMGRLARTYLATPRRREVPATETAPGTRRFILSRMRETFRLYHLDDRLDADVAVGAYVSPRFTYRIDYAYKPNGLTKYLHALSERHDLADASRLCFVFDRIRAQAPSELTAVVADSLPGDTHSLLQSSQIRAWPVSRLDDLAMAVREELGM